MEYYCNYCRDWFDTGYCETHFESTHGQSGVTFDALKKRLECLGGLDVRDENDDEREDNSRVFITNNFRHNL